MSSRQLSQPTLQKTPCLNTDLWPSPVKGPRKSLSLLNVGNFVHLPNMSGKSGLARTLLTKSGSTGFWGWERFCCKCGIVEVRAFAWTDSQKKCHLPRLHHLNLRTHKKISTSCKPNTTISRQVVCDPAKDGFNSVASNCYDSKLCVRHFFPLLPNLCGICCQAALDLFTFIRLLFHPELLFVVKRRRIWIRSFASNFLFCLD